MEITFQKKIEEYMFLEDEPAKADVIFVPGNRFHEMAKRAAQLYKEGFAPLCVPSGKYSKGLDHFPGAYSASYPGPYQSEAQFLGDVMEREGVPRQAILLEEEATFTWDNAKRTRELLDQAGILVKKGIICCKAVHARRCLYYYQRAFPGATLLICPVSPDGITRENWLTTKEGIDAVMQELHGLIWQYEFFMRDLPPMEEQQGWKKGLEE